jgi:hypothetical protein
MADALSFLHALKRANDYTMASGTLDADALYLAGQAAIRLDHMIAGCNIASDLDAIGDILKSEGASMPTFDALNKDLREAFS